MRSLFCAALLCLLSACDGKKNSTGNGSAYLGGDGGLTLAGLQKVVSESMARLGRVSERIVDWPGLVGFSVVEMSSPRFPNAREALSGLSRQEREDILILVREIGQVFPGLQSSNPNRAVVVNRALETKNASGLSTAVDMMTTAVPGAPIYVSYERNRKKSALEVSALLGHELAHWATGLGDYVPYRRFENAGDAFTHAGRFLSALALDFGASADGWTGALPTSANDGIVAPPADSSNQQSAALVAARAIANSASDALNAAYTSLMLLVSRSDISPAVARTVMLQYDNSIAAFAPVATAFSQAGDEVSAAYYRKLADKRPVYRWYGGGASPRFRSHLATDAAPVWFLENGFTLTGVAFYLFRSPGADRALLNRFYWTPGAIEFFSLAESSPDSERWASAGYVGTVVTGDCPALRRYAAESWYGAQLQSSNVEEARYMERSSGSAWPPVDTSGCAPWQL